MLAQEHYFFERWLPIIDTIRTNHFTEMVRLKPVLIEACKEFGIAA